MGNRADFIIVGSGINALVAAALLGAAGRRVIVLEREDEIGGCIKSGDIGASGFVHDLLATTFVLFITSPAYAELAGDLARHGLEFCNSDAPTGVLMPDGSSFVLKTDRKANIAALNLLADGDGGQFAKDVASVEQNAELIFGLLGGRLWSFPTFRLLARTAWKMGLRGFAEFAGEAMSTARGMLRSGYRSELSQALLAPWVLHTGLAPESAYSGQMARVIAFALEAAGAPVVKGGAVNITRAFRALVEERGGIIRTGSDVAEILTENGRAVGVRLAGGEELLASVGVACSVTPGQLYGKLLASVPQEIADATSRYQHGKGNFQLHYALDNPPKWKTAGLEGVALLHLTPGLDGVSKAANEAERGMLPETPTICVGQPSALDPSRCPDGKAVLWLQMPEAPRIIKGDAAGKLTVPADGCWNEELREAYADRIEAILEKHLTGFHKSIVARKALSPADLETMNINLTGGDPYGGYCGLDQSFIWRPFKGSVNHQTHIDRLWHIGASTHPGPGLGGGSGYLFAKAMK